jgi:ribulose-phosphate 3-epimerase
MSDVIPAIIPKQFADLEEKLGHVSGHVPMVHIDVMDGTFTKEKSWPYLSTPETGNEAGEFLKIVEGVEGFPFWEDLSFEAHLMVNEPEKYIEDWIKAGAERIIVHIESFKDDAHVSRVLALLKNQFDTKSAFLGIEVGLAINLDTPLEGFLTHILEADFIQLMSIDHDGAQGEKFDERVYERIKELRELFPETIISVDGGVSVGNADDLIELGVNRLVVGSAIFAAEEPELALAQILEVAQ